MLCPVGCAGINRHEAGNERFLRERSTEPLGPEFSAVYREVHGEACVGLVRRAGSLGLAALRLPNNGLLVLRSSIHIPKFVSPLVIPDKSRLR